VNYIFITAVEIKKINAFHWVRSTRIRRVVSFMSFYDWWDTSRGCASLNSRFDILINMLDSEYITGMLAYKLRREMDM
jgi:hypothetical protein